MLPKGFTRVSISKATEARLDHIRKKMIMESPQKYDETTNYHAIIRWLLDRAE